ncbi:autocrine proliferation repressor protein A-like [Physella acuta]|uniref:autocrine proliferation repressor protein A-like n=1 Tax=Physella acuta TaxID=109671 RepID=UPI0027DC1393|nr:autocrine proliferation repressor protein A-like [Physella acuta]
MSTELVLPALLLAAAILVSVTPTPLDDYVRQPDSHYSYSFISSIQGPNFEVYILNMTSQKWLTEAVTTKPIWWHYVSVIVPLSLKFKDTAFLFIDGGDNTDKLPSMEDQSLSGFTAMSVSTGAVCAVIGQIPNQPTVFLASCRPFSLLVPLLFHGEKMNNTEIVPFDTEPYEIEPYATYNLIISIAHI